MCSTVMVDRACAVDAIAESVGISARSQSLIVGRFIEGAPDPLRLVVRSEDLVREETTELEVIALLEVIQGMDERV